MLGVTDYGTFVVSIIVFLLIPGPGNLALVLSTSKGGFRGGLAATAGVILGDQVLMWLAVAGVAALLAAYPAAFHVVQWVGAGYLAWLGGFMLTAKPGAAPVLNIRPRQFLRQAFFITLLNPKAILFLLSFFVQFIDPTYPEPWVPFLILSAIVMTCSAVYLSCLIFAGARLAAVFRRRQGLSAGLSSAVGALFVWFGVKLAGASLA